MRNETKRNETRYSISPAILNSFFSYFRYSGHLRRDFRGHPVHTLFPIICVCVCACNTTPGRKISNARRLKTLPRKYLARSDPKEGSGQYLSLLRMHYSDIETRTRIARHKRRIFHQPLALARPSTSGRIYRLRFSAHVNTREHTVRCIRESCKVPANPLCTCVYTHARVRFPLQAGI